MKLYHNGLSTCSQKVRMVLAEKQLPFESHIMDLQRGDQFQPDYVKLNPGALVLPTASPVPLIAAFKSRHVLVSTAASKSVLRAAAQVLIDRFNHVDYFPNYEIVTSHANRAATSSPTCARSRRRASST